MSKIEIISNANESIFEELGIQAWPIWEKEISEFPWHYDMQEICYLIEGKVLVTPDQGDPVAIKAGDLVIFPKGLSCRWQIVQPVRKHYQFG